MTAVQPKKLCLLTGASGLLGEMFCQRFGSVYDIVGIFCQNMPRTPSQLQWFIDPLNPTGALPENECALHAIQANLLQDGEPERVVDTTLQRFGRIDVLVNSAAFSTWGLMLDNHQLQTHFHYHFNMNVLVPLQLSMIVANKFWRYRKEENQLMNRSVVNVSSTAGHFIYPGSGQGLYSASKGAMNYLTMHVADEFETIGVRANALAPNSFPALVPTEIVADGIMKLSESDCTGKILILDEGGERWA